MHQLIKLLLKQTLGVTLILALMSCSMTQSHFKNEMNNPHYKTEQLIINGEKRDYYTLRVGTNVPNTVIFFYTGSGCHDTSYQLYPLYKNLTLNADIISLAKKGIKKNSLGGMDTCSNDFLMNDNTNTHVSDSISLINHVLNKKTYEKIVLLGHSEGAGIAWRVAEKHAKTTHVYIMHRGLGMNNLDELKAKSPLANSGSKAKYDKLISDLEGKSNHFDDDDIIVIKSKKSWKSFLEDKRSPAEVLLKSGKKVLIMMGEKDTHVPVSSMYLSKKTFCQNKNSNLTAILIKERGHTIDLNDGSREAELDILAKWVSESSLSITQPFEILTCQNEQIINAHL